MHVGNSHDYFDWLIELRFYIAIDTKQVISEMLWPNKHMASNEETKIN